MSSRTSRTGARRRAALLAVLVAGLGPGLAGGVDRATAVPAPNTIGIYTNATDFVPWCDPVLFTPFEVTFLLVSPRTAAGDPVAFVDGFEYKVRVEPAGGVLRLADNLPALWTNLGDASSLDGAVYRMSGSEPLPVTADVLALHTWQLVRVNTDPHYFHLQPVDPPTIAGALAFSWPDGAESTPVAAQPSSGDPQSPVFAFTYRCPVDCLSFGAVKALFRR